ncbi:MAG: glycine cleavage system protein T [Deltaproteobacteria bacterium]|nr:glycine cleavage system protein T [Deltaproteobacteria bacterium]
MSQLQRTPLHAAHVALGARMVAFAGFDMPVQYSSIKEEHAAVREGTGLFDVSHMGQIHFTGPGSVETVERLLTCKVASLEPGRVRYGLLCNEEGGIVDDVTVYRAADEQLMLCVNAANVEKDYRWCVRHSPEGAEVRNRSAETALLALQGATSAATLGALGATAVAELKRFRFVEAELVGSPALISRTGYTGSDGFEVYLPSGAAVALWEALCAAGARPCGLGARDTLRLEAALPLYGQELDDTTSPLEAGLDRFVKLDAGGFLGCEAIRARREAGHSRQLVGFQMVGRGIGRAGYPISRDGRAVGVVTSGAPSPTLGNSIGLGYVPPALAALGERLDIVIRGRAVEARVAETPFV